MRTTLQTRVVLVLIVIAILTPIIYFSNDTLTATIDFIYFR